MAIEPAAGNVATRAEASAAHIGPDDRLGDPTIMSSYRDHSSKGQGRLDRRDHRLHLLWSGLSLRTCFGLALVYCWSAFFLSWGLGGSGTVGGIRLLADAPQPARWLSGLCAICLPLMAIWVGRLLGRTERRAKLSIIRWYRHQANQRRQRLRLVDFERSYRWSLGFVFGGVLLAVLVWLRRGDVATFTIIFSWLALGPVSGLAMARRFSNPTTQCLTAFIAGFASITGIVLLILAFAGAGVAVFAFAILGVTNVAFAGALAFLLELVMGGVFSLGLALAGAGVATVALALAGAGTGMATLSGIATMSRAGLSSFLLLMGGACLATLAFGQATVLAAVIGGVSALAVSSAVAHTSRGHRGAYSGALGSVALLTSAAFALGWGAEPLVIFAATFFILLPLINGPIGWLAWSLSASVMTRLLRFDNTILTIGLGGLTSIMVGVLSTASLAFLLGSGLEMLNQLVILRSGGPALDLGPMIDQAVHRPWEEGLWLTLILLTPLFVIVLQVARLVAHRALAHDSATPMARRPRFGLVPAVVTTTAIIALILGIMLSPPLAPAALFGRIAELGRQTTIEISPPSP